jgi:hypothetical protein
VSNEDPSWIELHNTLHYKLTQRLKIRLSHIICHHIRFKRSCFVKDPISIYMLFQSKIRFTFIHLQSQLTPCRQNPKVHRRIHKSPPPVPNLSQLDPIYTPPASLPKIHYESISPSTPWSPKRSPSLSLSHQNRVHIHLLSHACYISHPPHSPWFDLPNKILGGV